MDQIGETNLPLYKNIQKKLKFYNEQGFNKKIAFESY